MSAEALPATAGREAAAEPLIHMEDLWRSYDMGAEVIHALHGVSLDVQSGEYMAIMGPSGSGKSTLLRCVAGLDTLTSGQVLIDGDDVSIGTERGRQSW